MIRVRDLFLLGLLTASLLVWPLHAPPITTRGEAREAMVVRDMVRNDRWVLGYRLGVVASKPPFFHWLAAGPARMFGVTDAVVRWPSALGAWAMAGVTLAMGTALGGVRLGVLGAGVLGGMWMFWTAAVEARVDMVFAAAVGVALAAFFGWYRGAHTTPPVLCYVATACAVLTKGPAGAMLPAVVIVAFLALQHELGLLRRAWSWWLALGAAVVVIGWYGLAWGVGGRQFVAVQLLRENVDRLAGTGVFHARRSHPLSLLKLEGAFAVHLFPWSLVVPWNAWRWWRGAREDAGGRFLHVWWLTMLGLFSLAAGKRAVYLLPLYPAVALLAARALAPILSGGGARARGAAMALALVVVAAAAGGQMTRLRVAARDGGLVEFAAVVRRVVPPDEPVRVVAAVDEDDYVVLGWLTDRRLARGARRPCAAGGFLVEPARLGGGDGEVLATAERGGRRLQLRRCRARASG